MFRTECLVRVISTDTTCHGISPIREEVAVYRFAVRVSEAREDYDLLVLPDPVEGDELFASYSVSNQRVHQANIIDSWTFDRLVVHVDFYLDGMDFSHSALIQESVARAPQIEKSYISGLSGTPSSICRFLRLAWSVTNSELGLL